MAETDAELAIRATEADVAAERAIVDTLRSARPEDELVGEELGGAATSGRYWLVDPLCGTVNYAARTPLVAVNVALVGGAGVSVAVSADPFAAEVFWTDGEIAHLRSGGRDEPLVPGRADGLVEPAFSRRA